MTGKTTLLLPTNITPLNADWDRIRFLSAICCFSNPINAEQRGRVPILTKKLNTKELKIAFTEITQTHQRLLRKLTLVLNTMHGTNCSARFWEIQFGLPFLHLIASIYERRSQLLQAVETLRDQEWGIAIPKDLQLVFHTPIQILRIGSRFNAEDWILYADIALAENLPTVGTDLDPMTLTGRTRSLPLKETRKFSSLIKKAVKSVLLRGLIPLNRARNFFSKTHSSQISVPDYWRFASLLAWSKLKMNIVPNRDLDFSGIPRDSKHRNKFNGIIAESDFEQTLIRLLPKYLPVSLIEGFALVQKIAEPYVAPGLYFFPNSQGNTTYNFAAATAVDRLGAHIVTSQHGGGDGQYQIFFSEYLARRCSDYYISFGWQDSYYDGATVVPFSSIELSRMVKRNQTKVVNVKGLFVSTAGIPYFYRGDHWASMEGFEIYFNDQLAFLGHLENNIRNHMKYRPYPPNNLGWEETLDRLRERFPEILVVENENMVDALNTAKIIVIDHNSTTLLQAMAMNRPVVCYWQPLLFPFRTECVADFEELREVGILYDNPESAAQHVNSIWQKIDGWWQSDSVQKARNTFVAKYARTTTDVAVQWRTMLQRIARDAQTNTSPITGQKRRV